MNVNEILSQMSADISTLSFAEKMFGGSIVTLLSMGIVFVVLVILIGVIKAMDMILNGKAQKEQEEMEYIEEYEEEEEDSSELIAVISAAIASSMGVSESSIQVVNISRSGDMTPAWARNGRVEQIQSRL